MSSELNTVYVLFDVVDYKNENVLSSYALKQTPLLFVPELSENYATKVLWSFGDGTTSNLLCASKSYTYPGQYTVNLVVYDCFNNSQISSYSQVITIYDLVTFTFELSTGNTAPVVLENGKVYGPWQIKSYFPPYQPVSNIYYSVSASNSNYYFELSSNKFSHLENTYCIFDTISNICLSSQQFQEINVISPLSTALYAKIEDNILSFCAENDIDSFFVGTSGYNAIYFKDDSLSNKILIDFHFDKTNNFNENILESTIVDYYNNLSIILSATITDNKDVSHLSITTNGLDGEGYPIESFFIDQSKFENIRIPFVVKIKDSDNFTVKNFPELEYSDFNFDILSNNGLIDPYYYELSSINYTLSSQEHKGSFRGSLKFKNLSSSLINVSLSANLSIQNDQLTAFILSGTTNTFNVYPSDYYSIYKINENFDAQETFKSLRFQEILLDKNVLFDDFMGSIFGNLSSSYNSLGKKIYEKISNFVSNTQDVDRNELYSLISTMNMLDVKANIYESTFFNYPEIVKRVLNFASINKNKLFGTTNKFKENFDIRGHSSKEKYGRNIGNQINNDTYIISAGIPIVALEKFSNNYTFLNTEQPLSALSGAYTYMLSGYSDTWGWPLVLPNDFTYIDFPKYYIFFEYLSGFDGTITNNTINFDDFLTTIPQSATHYEMFSDNGIFVNMLNDSLYSSLKLAD